MLIVETCPLVLSPNLRGEEEGEGLKVLPHIFIRINFFLLGVDTHGIHFYIPSVTQVAQKFGESFVLDEVVHDLISPGPDEAQPGVPQIPL
jgi:hypothetical protein